MDEPENTRIPATHGDRVRTVREIREYTVRLRISTEPNEGDLVAKTLVSCDFVRELKKLLGNMSEVEICRVEFLIRSDTIISV